MSIKSILIIFAVISFIVYIYIILSIGKDQFLNTLKSEKELKRYFIKCYLPFCIVVAVIFIMFNIYILPFLIGILS